MDIMNIFSAVIIFNKGIVQKIEWDNDCYDCADANCSKEKFSYTRDVYYANKSTISETVNASCTNCKIKACGIANTNETYPCDPKVFFSLVFC